MGSVKKNARSISKLQILEAEWIPETFFFEDRFFFSLEKRKLAKENTTNHESPMEKMNPLRLTQNNSLDKHLQMLAKHKNTSQKIKNQNDKNNVKTNDGLKLQLKSENKKEKKKIMLKLKNNSESKKFRLTESNGKHYHFFF